MIMRPVELEPAYCRARVPRLSSSGHPQPEVLPDLVEVKRLASHFPDQVWLQRHRHYPSEFQDLRYLPTLAVSLQPKELPLSARDLRREKSFRWPKPTLWSSVTIHRRRG